MREDDEDFFSDLDNIVVKELEDNPMVFVNKRKKRKDKVTPEEQREADSHGKYLPPTPTHGGVVSDVTDGPIRRVTYKDGYVRTKVGDIWT